MALVKMSYSQRKIKSYEEIPPPSCIGHSLYIRRCGRIGHTMSRLLPEFEKAKEEPVSEVQEQDLSIEQEIECPRCHDVMTLCFDFGRLGYF